MSYGTDEGFETWLCEQGYTLAADAPASATLRARGSAYVDSYEIYWTGQRTGGVMQERGWPRAGATANCNIAIADNVIPVAVLTATYRAAWLDAQTPGVLFGLAVTSGARVKRQKVDAIEREFFDDGKTSMGAGPSFIDSMIDGLLGQFICDQKGGAFVWSLGS